jgi:hypothetical protein
VPLASAYWEFGFNNVLGSRGCSRCSRMQRFGFGQRIQERIQVFSQDDLDTARLPRFELSRPNCAPDKPHRHAGVCCRIAYPQTARLKQSRSVLMFCFRRGRHGQPDLKLSGRAGACQLG